MGTQKVGTTAADLLSGIDAALVDRNRTGDGHCIDVSMVESTTRFMTPRIVPYLGSGEVPHRSPLDWVTTASGAGSGPRSVRRRRARKCATRAIPCDASYVRKPPDTDL